MTSITTQTKRIQLTDNDMVNVFSYNDKTGAFELDYSVPGGIVEYEMQIFFNLK